MAELNRGPQPGAPAHDQLGQVLAELNEYLGTIISGSITLRAACIESDLPEPTPSQLRSSLTQWLSQAAATGLLTVADPRTTGSIGFYAAKFGVGFILRTGVPNLDGIGGAFGGNNEVGIAFARALPLMVAVAQNAVRPIVFWGSLSAIPLSAIGVISTYSRGSFLALVASAAVFASLQKHRVLTWSVLGVAAVIALLTVPLPDSFFERIRTIRTYEQVDDNSALGRLHFWRVALSMAGDHPLGVGLKNYQANFNRYDSSYGAFGSDRDVHNTHLQALVETGYFGFVCYVGLLWMSVALLLRIRKRAAHSALTPVESRFATTMANALLASTAAFFVGGTFNSLLINELNFYSFALVAALDRLTRQMIAARAITGKRHASAA
jgi:probable O-glycosylation ligase (exosortase A-associated)